jgi:polysaccharide deacetylase family protein (PEP-CTERM system associated)
MNSNKTILLTIDVEDWFQVENFKPWIPFETWDQRELRVERNTHKLLNLFDSIELKAQSSKLKADNQVKTDYELTKKVCATFFVLGWIAKRLPHLIREIHTRGHEIASHGYNHNLCNQQSHDELKKELNDSKKLLEDIIGSQVFGFRAPNFSIDDDVIKIIEECGYLYDSSHNSFVLHSRYGQISLNGHNKKGIAHKISENFFELPISNLKIRMSDIPIGGGGYFRLIPYWLFRLGVHSILKKDGAYVFYMHPWEIDPNQPKVIEASLNYRFRHYTNLGKTKSKLTNLLESFKSCRFITCSDYIK